MYQFSRIIAAVLICEFLLAPGLQSQTTDMAPGNDRKVWLMYLDKVARPVMSSLAEDKLKENMPVALSKKIDNAQTRSRVAYLEAVGRTLCGIAPWLNIEDGSKEEVALRNQYRQWALKGIANAVN